MTSRQKIMNELQGTIRNFMEINLVKGYSVEGEGDTITFTIRIKPELSSPKLIDTTTT